MIDRLKLKNQPFSAYFMQQRCLHAKDGTDSCYQLYSRSLHPA